MAIATPSSYSTQDVGAAAPPPFATFPEEFIMSRTVTSAVDRRQFLAQSTAGAIAATLPVTAFATGGDAIRIGLVGCGGRGTGAAAQALAADPAARLVAMGDLFGDQIDSSHLFLAGHLAAQVDCPRPRRFVGPAACRDVLAAGVDLVILAAPPAALPGHLTAAVRAGVHVYCEAPVAADIAGAHELAAAVEMARAKGLSIGAGLCERHDGAVCEAIDAIHRGRIGVPRAVRVEARIGLPWRRPTDGARDHAEAISRNWISCAALSGGAFVEHHVHAIDKALWALSDDVPVSAVGRPLEEACGADDRGVVVRYTFADGRTIDALCHRRPGESDRIVEVFLFCDCSLEFLHRLLGGGVGLGRLADLDLLLREEEIRRHREDERQHHEDDQRDAQRLDDGGATGGHREASIGLGRGRNSRPCGLYR